jgi:hypothetical protein
MAHRRAKLTVFGRHLLVGRVELEGWTVARAADVSAPTMEASCRVRVAYGRSDLEVADCLLSRGKYRDRLSWNRRTI